MTRFDRLPFRTWENFARASDLFLMGNKESSDGEHLLEDVYSNPTKEAVKAVFKYYDTDFSKDLDRHQFRPIGLFLAKKLQHMVSQISLKFLVF